MMRTAWVLGAALALTALPAYAQEEHRHLGAHVHGHGSLNIAIEGKTVSMELEVPGADIVGFEHEPSTPEQKAALAKAKAKLADGLSIITPVSAAGCSLKSAKVATQAEHEDEHEHEHEAEGAATHEEESGHHHSEFHVEYSLECSSPSRLTAMTFDYFKAFPNAQELDIAVITPKGQSSFEVKRDKPSLDLTGIM
ncbi:MAG: DUF2796 domain-containing protein [Rhodomicrobium sp.]